MAPFAVVTVGRVPSFHESLGSRVREGSIEAAAFASAFAHAFGPSPPGNSVCSSLHACFLHLVRKIGPAKGASWLSSLRGGSGGSSDDAAQSLNPTTALCCGVLPFCDGSTEAKLAAGFAICGRHKQLDLHGFLAMLQASLVGAQALMQQCFTTPEAVPPGLPQHAAPLLQYEWLVVEELLRERVLARLVQYEAEHAKGGSRWLGALAPKFGAAPKFTVGQLLAFTHEEVLARGDPWQAASVALAQRQQSLEIDAALQREQEERRRASAHAKRPHQILLVGRQGCGRSVLFDTLQRVFRVRPSQTTLDSLGLRQLGFEVAGGQQLLLLDLGREPTTNPSRLRKAMQLFDQLAAVVYMAALDDLRDPTAVECGANLYSAVVSGCAFIGRVQAGQRAAAGLAPARDPVVPLFLLLNKRDVLEGLLASGELVDEHPELAGGDVEHAISYVCSLWQRQTKPGAAVVSPAVLLVSAHDEAQVVDAVDKIALCADARAAEAMPP